MAAAYSTVGGTLPLDDLPHFALKNPVSQEERRLSFVRIAFDVSTPGPIKIVLNSAKGVNLWLDGEPVDAKGDVVVTVAAGVRTLTVGLDRTQRPEPLRVELDDAPGSAARARVLGGK